MAYTVSELYGELVDLGFEEDSITNEYGRIFVNSTNRALDIVYNIVVPQIESYYRLTESWGYLDDETNEWVLPKPRHISESSEPDERINIADNLKPLIPLLAAHYVWLDDDVTKATLYWNEYDQLKDQIIMVCRQPRKAKIIGGVGF